ncbi:hypothetical protein [Tautonia plasticadhaerens]|uniref:Uncharacterized protein n=1 Tax=Tautonia plasticadhaerens TaxID=2527974 RepID=A0A518H3U4_9BACT|nr:hypothetical protein [Tautonia plasticadhaerens]QDV35482.1 hypothetical protein ElP_33850 [Tautonia plasticadhaerens]
MSGMDRFDHAMARLKHGTLDELPDAFAAMADDPADGLFRAAFAGAGLALAFGVGLGVGTWWGAGHCRETHATIVAEAGAGGLASGVEAGEVGRR